MRVQAVLIVGCGDVGERVGTAWRRRGATVRGLVRTPERAAALRALNIAPCIADLDDPQSLRALGTGDALVYYLAPPPAAGLRDTRMQAFLEALPADAPPRRVVYISTTGVYGDRAGEWVDEDTPASPGADRARRRLDAETALLEWGRRAGVPVVVLRVAGIYGPGRLPVDRLRRGEPVLRERESGFTNRVHIHDLVRVCVAAGERGDAGIYNVSDGSPGTMTGYFNAVADALGMPRPPAIPLAEAAGRLSEGMLSYLRESRRIDNRRMREVLGVSPDYPDLASGLAAIVAGGDDLS